MVELWSAGFRAAGVVEVNIGWVDAGAGEGVVLVVGILVCGGNSRISSAYLPCLDRVGRPVGLTDIFCAVGCLRLSLSGVAA